MRDVTEVKGVLARVRTRHEVRLAMPAGRTQSGHSRRRSAEPRALGHAPPPRVRAMGAEELVTLDRRSTSSPRDSWVELIGASGVLR